MGQVVSSFQQIKRLPDFDAVVFVDTVAALGSITNPANGRVYGTKGYYAAGDGGGNIYQYVNGSLAVVDGGFVIDGPASAGRFLALDTSVADIRQFGCKLFSADNDFDNAASIKAACDAALAFGASVYLPNTKDDFYKVTAEANVLLTTDLIINAEGCVIKGVKNGGRVFCFTPKQRGSFTFSGSTIFRGSTTITLADATGIQPGDLLHLSSQVTWSLSYTKNEVHIVRAVAGNNVTIATPVIFNYDTAGTPTADTISIAVYEPWAIKLHGQLKIIVDSVIPAAQAGPRVFDIHFQTRPVLVGLKITEEVPRFGLGADPISFNGCFEPYVENVDIFGCRYPFAINNCRGGLFENIASRFVWHPVDPRTCYDLTFKKMRGYYNQSTIQCHASFRVHWDDVICIEGNGIAWRSVGGSCKNVKFITSRNINLPSNNQNVVFNTAESTIEDLHGLAEFECTWENVYVEAPNTTSAANLPFLTSNPAGYGRFINCDVPRILINSAAISADGAGCEIRGCNVQAIWCRSNALRVYDTVVDYTKPNIDASLRIAIAIRSGSGTRDLRIKNCDIKNGHEQAFSLEGAGVKADISGNAIEDLTVDLCSITTVNFGRLMLFGNVFNNCTAPFTFNPTGTGVITASGNITRTGTAAVHPGARLYTEASPVIHRHANADLDSSVNAIAANVGAGQWIGQMITIRMTNATNPSTVSVTNHVTSNPEVFTFDAVGEYLTLIWTGAQWATVSGTATT